MNKNKKIIDSAKRTLTKELESIKTLKSVLNKNFYEAVYSI